MAHIPGAAAQSQRPASSISAPRTQTEAADLHRLRSTAVFAVAHARGSGLTAPLVARGLERALRLRPEGEARFQVAPADYPADFLITFRRRSDRDAALDQRSFPVGPVLFKLCPWVPPPGGHPFPRFYCRVAIEPLPLRAWQWDLVADMLGMDCDLDRIERQSLTRRNTDVLFAWVWAWSPDDIPLSSEISLLDFNHATPPEGSVTEVLIHLDETQDYTHPHHRRLDRHGRDAFVSASI